MKLLIDAGNSRAKWEVVDGGATVAAGSGQLIDESLFDPAQAYAAGLRAIAISIVAAEEAQHRLVTRLSEWTSAPVRIYPAEPERNGLRCGYANTRSMGADRWHAMYAAWCRYRGSLAVVDAGSALTIDFVAASGDHLGGYILPGRAMMLRSLSQDAARIRFDDRGLSGSQPGKSTDECVQHGQHWAWQALASQLARDCARLGIDRVFLTGGDAGRLAAAGLQAEQVPRLVIEGIARIDDESER
ncbi:MAG: type III pantothenate kinase [Marinobacter sp.]|nr:type III pantothenate kinase [Marinobacter sp.]